MYSNVVCIGDSYTNEEEMYKSTGADKIFKEKGYEFKSYPQLLGEYYNCKWETFGEPGMPMVFTLQTLIDKIPYILSLKNPLVIYQFGFFTNLILHIKDEDWVNWKSIDDYYSIQSKTKYGVISAGKDNVGSRKDELLLLDYTKRFGEQTNYWIVQYFCTISDILEKLGKSNVYGIFLSEPDFKITKSPKLLPFSDTWYDPKIKDILPEINDNHKSTESNQKVCDYIVNNL